MLVAPEAVLQYPTALATVPAAAFSKPRIIGDKALSDEVEIPELRPQTAKVLLDQQRLVPAVILDEGVL